MSDAELKQIEETIESRLRASEPEVELLVLERPATERLRLVIDSPDGVDIALCERVTGLLRDLLVDWSLEVSSPGPERPLSKPEHFRRFVGSRVRVKTGASPAALRTPTMTASASTRAMVPSRFPWRRCAART
jgi:ribosome maturation factor RimP